MCRSEAAALTCAPRVCAQDCVPADITLASQAEVDGFQAAHGPCDRVAGRLTIAGADIANLSGLSALVDVSSLYIASNDDLTGLVGLENLERVGSLDIGNNPSLLSLTGLNDLSRVAGNWLDITNNDALASLHGLEALHTVAGSLIIQDNDALQDIDALSALTTATIDPVYSIEIQRNPALLNLNGLTAVGGLGIVNNASLSDIKGLSNLETVHTWLEISSNPLLASLDGFGELQSAQNLTLEYHPVLTDCLEIASLVDPLDDFEPGPGPGTSGIPDIGDVARVQFNAEGCNSINGILGQVPLITINPGLSDAWFYPPTDGQGFFIIVFPEIEQNFLSWFTFDTERPPQDSVAELGEPGHRWLTAQGGFSGNLAQLEIWIVEGVVRRVRPRALATTRWRSSARVHHLQCGAAVLRHTVD